MHRLRLSITLRTWVLGWFLASLGVAVASPLVQPRSLQIVCSAAGMVMLVVQGDDGSAGALDAAGMDCPLCTPTGAPPAPEAAPVEPPQPLAHALQPIDAARIAAATAAPLPARGPPPSTL